MDGGLAMIARRLPPQRQRSSDAELAKAAVLVSITLNEWRARVKETEFTGKVAKEGRIKARMVNTTKRLIAQDKLSAVTTAFAQLRAYYYQHTSPWLDNGPRLLANALHLEFMDKYRELKQNVDNAVEEFLAIYPDLIDETKSELGDAWNPNEYPTIDRLRKRYGVHIYFGQIPARPDIRLDLPEAALRDREKAIKELNDNVQDQIQQGLKNVSQDCFERLYKVIEDFKGRVSEHKVTIERKTGKRKVVKTFRDSAVGNIRDLCELLPKLNFANDPELDRIAREVTNSLASYEPEVLRKDKKQRDNAVAQADALLAKLGAYVGDVD